jgi:hypothetical protein
VKFWYEPETYDPKIELTTLYLMCRHVVNFYCDDQVFNKDYISLKLVNEKMEVRPFFVSFEFTMFPTKFYRTHYNALRVVLDTLSHKLYNDVFEGKKTCYARKKKKLKETV